MVNEVLKQEKVPEQALTQNEDVERKVAIAADDMNLVNVKITEEIAARIFIESELVNTKTDLAEARDDLSKAQVKMKEAPQIVLQDALTGLPNRVSFEQGLNHGLNQANWHGWELAVLFIDIDKFKSINDFYGHDLGDQVLLMVANRLKSSVRSEDLVSRWGGEEFVCLLFEVTQEADVTRLAEMLINRLSEACDFNGTTLSISVSIGIAIYPADGEIADILFKNGIRQCIKPREQKSELCCSEKLVSEKQADKESTRHVGFCGISRLCLCLSSILRPTQVHASRTRG